MFIRELHSIQNILIFFGPVLFSHLQEIAQYNESFFIDLWVSQPYITNHSLFWFIRIFNIPASLGENMKFAHMEVPEFEYSFSLNTIKTS